MDPGDSLTFQLCDGQIRQFELIGVDARVLYSNLRELKKSQGDGGTVYEMTCLLRIDGQPLELRRYVGTQESFYEPCIINGVRVWFDGVSTIKQFLSFGHGECLPGKAVRLALQGATLRICPDPVQPWFDCEELFVDIGRCNNGDDCWMGPFMGFDAHSGLDIDQKAGTLQFAPIAFDEQYLFNSLAAGDENNRWRGVHRWPGGDTWHLQTHHLLAVLQPDHVPLGAGKAFATSAGVKYGSNQHTHYEFKVMPAGEMQVYPLDPWIVFWQSFEDVKNRRGDIQAAMAPLSPAKVGDEVVFDASNSRPGAGRDHLQMFWTFGDGGGANIATPHHTFAQPGVYPVTLTVYDGMHYDTQTQHITINGEPLAQPALALNCDREPTFRKRPSDAMDVYGLDPHALPHSISLLHRQNSATMPEPRRVRLVNLGGGEPAAANVQVVYEDGQDWLDLRVDGQGNDQQVYIAVKPQTLPPALYRARVIIRTPGAANSEQPLSVSLLVPSHPAHPPVSKRNQHPTTKVIDDADEGFYATPWFWIGHRLKLHPHGYGGFHLMNGGRAREGEYARFTPDLDEARYEVSLSDQTPFDPDVRFAVHVHHAQGDQMVWMEPARSRRIGVFAFHDGTDGYVEILAAGSTGQVLADAVVFKRLDQK